MINVQLKQAINSAYIAYLPLGNNFFANLVNIFLNWVLIYGNLGMPALGVAGAGIASSAAMLIQIILKPSAGKPARA